MSFLSRAKEYLGVKSNLDGTHDPVTPTSGPQPSSSTTVSRVGPRAFHSRNHYVNTCASHQPSSPREQQLPHDVLPNPTGTMALGVTSPRRSERIRARGKDGKSIEVETGSSTFIVQFRLKSCACVLAFDRSDPR